MEASTFRNHCLPVDSDAEQPRNQTSIRAIFCAYWLYFNAVRAVVGEQRLLDYLGMSCVVIGLVSLVSNKLLDLRLVRWVTILCSPLAFAAILNPNMDTIIFFLKTYVLALYLSGYFKSMRLTIVEFACFTVPVVVSVYFFLNPRPFDMILFLHGRMSGISEPNFTSLSLIISMCGAFGIYLLTGTKRAQVVATAIVCICVIGVVLTGSRAGFIGTTIPLSLFLMINKKTWYASLAMASVTLIIGSNSVWSFLNDLLAFQRLQSTFGAYDPIMALFSERSFTEIAWYQVQSGEWFIGGSPHQVAEWSNALGIAVPHNSLLDIGLAFGKASFYFYGVLLVVLLGINLRVLSTKWRQRNQDEKDLLLAPMLFLSLLPMYMTLSAGMAMDFILWMVVGAYPLLRLSPKLVTAPAENATE